MGKLATRLLIALRIKLEFASINSRFRVLRDWLRFIPVLNSKQTQIGLEAHHPKEIDRLEISFGRVETRIGAHKLGTVRCSTAVRIRTTGSVTSHRNLFSFSLFFLSSSHILSSSGAISSLSRLLNEPAVSMDFVFWRIDRPSAPIRPAVSICVTVAAQQQVE